MNFEDVELARQAYVDKNRATSQKRKKYAIIFFSIFLMVDLLFFVTISLSSTSSKNYPSLPIIIASILAVLLIELIIVIIGVYVATGGNNTVSEYQAYRHAYKGYFIARQLANTFTNLKYNHQLGINRSLLEETGLIYTGDRYHSNDFTQGKYKDISFTQADVQIEEKEEQKDKDGHIETYYNTIFKGRYLIFEFPKEFNFKMVISFHGYNQAYINPKTGRGLNRIETESIEFNKRFLVYAEDGFEAFYILTPVIIENLEKLGHKYHDQLALYFSDRKLYIGLNDGGDAFEPPAPDNPLDEAAETAKVQNDIKLITELVDNLKLGT